MAIDTNLVNAHAGTGWGSVFDAINKAQQGLGAGTDFTARVQDLNDAGLGTQLRTSARSPFGHMMNFNDRAYATGWNIPWTSNFQAPVAGVAGPGGAMSGMGQGASNGNPFDINAAGAGLWSAGYDVNDAANVERLYWQLAMSKDATKKPELARFYGQPAGTQFTQNDLQEFLNAADWYYRDQARQVDKSNKFGDSLVGKIVIGALTAASGGAFGPLGGAAIGSALGAGTSSDQGMGALMGGLGGFTSGLTANAGGLTNLIKNPSSAFQGSGWYLPGGGGLVSAPTVAGAATGAAKSAASTVGTAAAGGILGNGAAGAAGGSGMGFFSTLGDFLLGNAGDIISAGAQLYGSNQVANAQTQAAQTLANSAQFKPYNVTTPAGGGFFNGTTATGALSPEIAAQYANQTQAAQQAYGAYQGFNPQNFAQNMYSTIKSYNAPNDTFQANDFLDKLYASGQWDSTPGERSLFNFSRGKQAEDNALRFQAQQAGGAESDRLFNSYLKAAQAQMTTAQSPLEYLRLGGNFGGAAAGAAANAAQYPWQAALNSSDATAAFWQTLGNGFSNLLTGYRESTPNRAAYTGPLSPGYQYN